MAASLRVFAVIVLFWNLPISIALAQSEVERDRRTLQGIDGFYLSLNTEGAAAVQDSLDFQQLYQNLRHRLRDAGVPVLPEDPTSVTRRAPYLHVHVNVVYAGRGLYPFGVEIRFYQAVHLDRAPSTATMASTWNTSISGLASYDQLGLIPETARALLDEFIEAFHQANP